MKCETNRKSGRRGVLGTFALSLLLVLSCDPQGSAAAERAQRDAARAMQADIAALSDSEAEPVPNEEESPGEGKQDGTPSASASDGDAGTEEPASPEVVRFVFDKNTSRGADSHVSGTMDDYEFPMDDKPHSLPKNAYSRSNHDFVGWSLTADGRDVADNPETADIDETFRTLMIKDGLEMTNLGYDERIEEKSVDEHGNEVTQTRILPRNLEYAVREHEVRLYAQWRERPPNDARATSADDVTAKDDAAAADDATTESELESDDDGAETRQTKTQAKAETQPDAGPNEPATKTDTDTESDAGSTGSTANSPKAPVAPMGRDEETTDDGDLASVNMAEVDGVRAVTVGGDDLSDAVIAKSVRRSLGASGATADEAIRALASKSPAQPLRMSAPQDDDIPRDLDGSTIESILVSWVTPDDAPDGDESRLSMRPPNDDPQTVRMRVSYALSGQHDYPAGDVTITVPAEMFSYRDGSPAGRWVIPYPQEPSATNDFMWSRVGDTFVLTNARRLSAATKGYIEFQVENLVPHRLVDQGVTEPFWARIEAATHLGNTIGLTSNSIDAVIDTESKVTSAYKYNYDSSIEIVDEDEIPEGARVSGEHEYVLVSWYMYAWVGGNTEFTLDLVDRRGDEYSGRRVLPTVGDATQPYSQRVLSGYRTGSVGYATVQYAYPLSQFAPDVTHAFENTVTYTLTETDPAKGDDPRLVTTASHTATRPWAWHAPEFRIPQGHFMLQKYGNDGKDGNNPFPYAAHNYRGYYSPRLDTTIDNFQGWYGIYPSALNDLAEGNDTEIAYTLQSIGYVMPWTYDGTSDLRKMSSYGVRPVTMVTTDADDALEAPTWLLAAGKVPLQANADFDYVAVEFPATPYIAKATRVNLDENGNFVALHAGDGTFDYQADTDISHVPDVTLEAKVDGGWRPVATASWSSGQLGITAYDTLSTGSRVILPPGTEQLRTSVTTTNAAVSYYVRPIVRIRSDGAVGNAARAALATSNAPSMQLYNSSVMVAYDADGEEIVDIHKEEQDTLQGYSTDVAVIPSKHMAQSQSDVDYDTRKVTVHYSAEIQERSLIPDRITYEQAKRDGKLVPDTQGVFYDLLPKGMTPVMESVRLREADRIESANTIENWRGTGRTMLIVRARLLPLTKSYEDSGVRRFMDELRISFDATYPFAEMKDYGTTPHNVIAYESLVRSPLGSIEHHGAEPDDPRSRNNDATAEAFADNGERDAMTLLDATKTGDRFVYAGASGTIDIPSAAFTSLSKLVQVNGDGRWSTGLADDRRNVYEGGLYDYQLRMMSEIGTLSKNLVMYDSLEEFRARQGNEPEDIDAPRWQGTLLSVDVSQLRALGCEPVVYYSTQENLQLADETDPDVAHPTNTDLSQSSIWVKAEDYEHDHADLSGVHAVAIDCRKATGGTDDFILGSLQSAVVILRMWAPSGEPAREYIAQDAHAYNNVYLHCTSIDSETLVENSDSFVHADYTKVGLEEMSVFVRKEWEDDDDRDGIRPQSLTVRLLANGQETGLSAQLQAPSWSGRIDNVPYTDGHGQKIEYMLVEDVHDGYESSIERGTEWAYEIRNRHEPERISVSGTKIWEGGEDARPAYVTVRLLADGKEAQRRIVSPDADGEWKYSFDNLLRYRDGGTEIAYRVEEVPEDPRWVVSSDGNDIVNTYHPFGDLSISKTCRGQTPVEAGQQFEMRLSLLGADGNPLAGEYAYSISDGNGHPLRSGTVSHGGSVMLSDGETATIEEIPHGTSYRVEEVVPDGYSLIDVSGTDGTIRANGTCSASLTNLYHAEGSINLHATKQLSGRALRKHQFRAELRDSSWQVLRTATNQTDGSMTFGALSYTEADARTEPYVYRIRETLRDLSGYTFDRNEYRAYVTVTDNGDGTLSTSVRYENANGDTVAVPEFRNEYHASGSLTLKAWKQLKGRPLRDGEFEFELRDENGAVLQTATNSSDGSVQFAPIAYDESAAGKSFSYIVCESDGNDTTVTYSDEAYQYAVSVTDNGDGTLSFSQSAEKVEFRERYMNSGELNQPETDFNLDRTDVWVFRGKTGDAAETLYVLPKVDPPNDPTTTSPTVDPEVTAITTPADAVEWMNSHFEGLNMTEADIGPSGFRVDSGYIMLHRTWLGDWPALREWLGENIDSSLGEGELKCVTFEFYGGADTSDITWKNSSASSSSVYAYNLTGEHVYDIVRQDQPEIVAPVFTNTLKPGALRVEKHVDEVPEGHEDDQFHFKVRLSGEDIEDGQYEYIHEQIPTSTAVAGEGASGVRRIIESVWESLCDMLSPREALADSDIRHIAVTYDAGSEGAFANGSTTNVVEYDVRDNVEQTKYSHTANLADDKTKSGSYAANLSTKDIVSIPGASSLHVVLEYGTEDSWDMVYVFQGEYAGEVTRNMSAGQLAAYTGGGDMPSTVELDVPGDTATFAFYSDGGGQYWGYHATVTGTGTGRNSTLGSYEEPIPYDADWRFVGWEQGEAGLVNHDAIFDSTTLTARYENLWQDFTQNGSSFQWYVDEEGNLRIRAIAGTTGTMQFASSSEIPWPNTITSIHIDQGHTIHASGSFYQLFAQDTSLITADLTGLDTSSVTNMAYMFNGCYRLESLVLPDSFVTSNVTTMRSMFCNCPSLSSLDLSNFATSEVSDMGSMFWNCRSLTSLVLPDTFDTSNVTDMECMFDDCYNLVSLTLPDTFNTSHVTKMNNMFNDCRNLESLNLPDAFDTSHVIEMKAMFSRCRTLVSLPLPSAFNTSRITSTVSMFEDCRNLVSLTLPSTFNTSNVTDMTRMFENCSRLESLTLSDSFDTSNVTNMYHMFQGCSSLVSIDLSHFNTAKVTDMGSMFSGCNQLSSITLGTRNGLRGYALTTASGPSSSWENIATGAGPKNFVQLAEMGPNLSAKPELMGEWTKVTPGYRISFDPDGGSGAMPPVKVDAPSETSIPAYTIPPSTFRYFGHSQTGWDDGNGNTYGLEDTIPANKYANGSRVVLYATWAPEDTTLELANGEMELLLGSNEAATFENIPAGTAYTVYEETPEGWVLVSQGNTSGNILPNATATASFTNRYDEASTSVSLVATKTLDGQGAEAGAFRFELREGGRLIESVTNSQGGGVAFSPIVYSEGDVGTHTYTITEVAGNDENIVYDGHAEIAEVAVTKNGTNMLANVAYDADGAAFANATIPGSIRIEKQTQGGGDPDQEFEFELELKNTQVGEITGESLPVASGTSLAKAMSSPVDILSMIMNLLSPTVAEASEGRIDAGTAYAIETDDSQLVFFRSNMTYQEGETRTVTDVAGHSYHGTVHTGCEGDGYAANKWSHENITAVRVSDGCLIRPQTMASWFKGMPNLTNVDLRGMDTSETTYMWNCIADCPKLESVDLSELDVSGLSYAHTILTNVPMLHTLALGETFDTRRAELSLDPNSYTATYWVNTSVPHAALVKSSSLCSNYDGSATTGSYARGTYRRQGFPLMMVSANKSEGVITTAVIDLTKPSDETYYDNLIDDYGNSYSGYAYAFSSNWYLSLGTSRESLRTVRVADGAHIAPEQCSSWFSGCTALEDVDLSNLDFSRCTNMSSMFSQTSSSLNLIDVSQWNTSRVERMDYMFQQSGITSFDLAALNMTNVTSAYDMFQSSGVQSINAHGMRAPRLTLMRYMFENAQSLRTADFSDALLPSVTDMSHMFQSAYSLVFADFSGVNAYSCTTTAYMFNATPVETVDFSRALLPSLSDCAWMFLPISGASGPGHRIPGSRVSFVAAQLGTSLQYMFQSASQFETISFQYANTSRVTDTSRMFQFATGLVHLDMRGVNLAGVQSASYMFDGAFSDSTNGMPGYLLDLRDAILCSSMASMFYKCGAYGDNTTTPTYGIIDLTGAVAGPVTDMSSAFAHAATTEIRMPDLYLGGVRTMDGAFDGTAAFTQSSNVEAKLDCSGTRFGSTTAGLFRGACLTDINLSDVHTEYTVDMSGMFQDTHSLSSLDLRDLRTMSVTDMSNMFSGTELQTIDVSQFNVHSVTNMDGMFADSQLKTIYSSRDAEWDVTSAVSDGASTMFSSSSLVVGGNGTAYDERSIDISMARVDGLDGAPGYFTIGTGEAIVQFDPNGGNVLIGETEVVQKTRIAPVSFPTVVSNGNVLVGWNTKADGTGEEYPLANRIIPELGKVIYLFAQWMPEGDAYSYEVVHRQERANALGEYEVVGRETRHAGTLSGVTVAPNQYPGFETPDTRTVDIEADGSTSVTFDYVRKRFTVTLDGNGFAESSMQEFVGGIRQTLAPAPAVEGKRFVGWSGSPDGSGGFFADGQEVMLDGSMTLYAQYVDATAAGEQVGLSTVMRLKVKAGESVSVPNIPAGTIYSVREINIPAGWSIYNIIANGGMRVSSNAVSVTTVYNRYSATGTFDVVAYKTLAGRNPQNQEFTFQLYDQNGALVRSTTNDGVDERITVPDPVTGEAVLNAHHGQALITFDDIVVTEPGTYHYTIVEANKFSPSIRYDEHVEEVTVIATDRFNGTLDCTVLYDADGALFENGLNGTSLGIRKHVSVPPPSGVSPEFGFEVALADASGDPLPDGTFQVEHTGTSGTTKTSTELRNGRMHLSVSAGGVTRILNLPANTVYSISEDNLPGWHVESSVGTSNRLQEGQDATASFTNAYSASGKFSVRGTKRIAGGMLPKDGEFSFALTDDTGAFVARATNGADGEFSFPEFPIDPAWVGTTATYHVVEEKGTDENIIYDEHVEDVSVTFSDDGEGTLSGAVAYDSDGCRFTNARRIAMPDAGSLGLGWGAAILGTTIVTTGCIAAEARRRRLRGESTTTGK